MKRIYAFGAFILLLIVFRYLPQRVLADGMVVGPADPYSNRWDYVDEKNQQAFINYLNGFEKLIISIGVASKESNGAVWIFPVPADPGTVTMNILESQPGLEGEDISKLAKSHLDTISQFLQATQLYTIPFVLQYRYRPLKTSNADINSVGAMPGAGTQQEQDVVVYSHLEKEGVTTEVITAKTAGALADYFTKKGLKISGTSLPVLQTYIGKQYSFVASWMHYAEGSLSKEEITQRLEFNDVNYLESYLYDDIYADFRTLLQSVLKKFPSADLEKCLTIYHQQEYYCLHEYYFPKQPQALATLVDAIYKNPLLIAVSHDVIQKYVFITFPTKQLYYPLLPTSVYNDTVIPTTIRVVGFVTPNISGELQKFSDVTYYEQNAFYAGQDVMPFFSDQPSVNKYTTISNLFYTKIDINAPSKIFTDDLWISPQPPLRTYLAMFIDQHPTASAVLLYIFCSCLAGNIVGLILFPELRKAPLKLEIIGLSNCLTILGLTATVLLSRTKRDTGNSGEILTDFKQKGYIRKRRAAVILFFMTVPFLLFDLIAIPFILRDWNAVYSHHFDIRILLLFMIPVIAGIGLKKLLAIQPQDAPAFSELKASGYSAWTFQPKDGRKLVFIPVFSIAFLLLSWGLTYVIGLVV